MLTYLGAVGNEFICSQWERRGMHTDIYWYVKVSNYAGVCRLEHNYIVRYIKISNQLYCQIYKNILTILSDI